MRRETDRPSSPLSSPPVYGSLKIGTLFGIPIRLHWSFFVLAWMLLVDPVLLFVLFGSVLLHELGHSLMARRFGIQVMDITFWPLGGMARMSEIPEVPRVEGLVAIAGPLVNFVLAGLSVAVLVIAALIIGHLPDVGTTLGTAAYDFGGINLALGLFNLVPAFPMDGGRILRAVLARRMDWVRATEGAVKVGRAVSGALVAVTLLSTFVYPSLATMFCTSSIIAAYLWFAGTRELLAVRLRHGHSPFGAMGRQDPFRPAEPASTWNAPSSPPPSSEPETFGGARRPAQWEGKRPGRGFDEARVRELEQFRGRLHHPGDDET